jgi:hypothetical protein
MPDHTSVFLTKKIGLQKNNIYLRHFWAGGFQHLAASDTSVVITRRKMEERGYLKLRQAGLLVAPQVYT